VDGLAEKKVVNVQFPYYYPSQPPAGPTDSLMKTWKSEHDPLLDQALVLVKAAIDDGAKPPLTERSSSARGHPLRPRLAAEIAVEKTTRIEQDLLVEDTLSLIEHVTDGEAEATGLARGAERLKVADAISRMASDLDTLRNRVASFKEAQQKFQREREAYCAMTLANVRAAQWTPSPTADRAGADEAKNIQSLHPHDQAPTVIDAVATARPDQTAKLSAKRAGEPEHTGPSDHDSISRALAAIDRALSKASNGRS
jgi:hypothetical protein